MNSDGTFRFKNEEKDFNEAKRGLEIAKELIIEGKQDVLILDEAIATVAYNLLMKEKIEVGKVHLAQSLDHFGL